MATSNSSSKKKTKIGIYIKSVLQRKVVLSFDLLGGNLKKNLLISLQQNLEGKCSTEGYIKNKSIQVLSYSAGVVEGSDVSFVVSFECLICKPCEGMIIKCLVKNKTKAGIRAIIDSEESPLTIFIAREHHSKNETYNKAKENDMINAKVIGIRYQLNDDFVSILGELDKIVGMKKLNIKK